MPTMHFTIAEGFVKATTVGQMGWFFLMAVMYITGAGLYAARIPERFFPGKFDIWVSVGVNRVSGGSSGVRRGSIEWMEAGGVQLCLSTCWQAYLEQVLCMGRAGQSTGWESLLGATERGAEGRGQSWSSEEEEEEEVLTVFLSPLVSSKGFFASLQFQSHQIFHVLVVAAAFVHFYGVSNLQEFRYGLEGGCTDDSLL